MGLVNLEKLLNFCLMSLSIKISDVGSQDLFNYTRKYDLVLQAPVRTSQLLLTQYLHTYIHTFMLVCLQDFFSTLIVSICCSKSFIICLI